MASKSVNNIKVIKLNLLEGSKYVKKEVGISWGTFIASIVLIAVMTVAPIVTLKLVNNSLNKKIAKLNETYSSLRKKEQAFKAAVKEKETIMKFIDTAYSIVSNQPKLDIVLDEIRKRLPKGSTIQGGISLSVKGNVVSMSLKVISDNYLDAPQLIDAFSQSPYLYVKSAKLVPLNIASLSKGDNNTWSYSVQLLLGWKSQGGEGETK